MAHISAVIIALNEQDHIGPCIQSLDWADEVLVVDGGSTDKTVERSRQAGARVLVKAFVNFADQRNFAMQAAVNPWIFFMDADERVSVEAAAEILAAVKENIPAIYQIPRINYFFGKRMNYSGGQNDFQTRLFPKAGVLWTQPVHERIVSDFPRRSLKNALYHSSTRDFEHYLRKVACYVPLEIQTMKINGRKAQIGDILIRPLGKFFYLYFYRLGFLDGWTGLQFSVLSSYYDYKKYFLFYKSSF